MAWSSRENVERAAEEESTTTFRVLPPMLGDMAVFLSKGNPLNLKSFPSVWNLRLDALTRYRSFTSSFCIQDLSSSRSFANSRTSICRLDLASSRSFAACIPDALRSC